jgi:hypothetical protein
VHRDECGDEQLGDRFEIDPKLAQIRAQAGPHSFTRIRMRFARAISIGIPRPFARRVAHRRMAAFDPGIAVIFIGVDVRALPRELLHMRVQGRLLRVRYSYPGVGVAVGSEPLMAARICASVKLGCGRLSAKRIISSKNA